MYGEASYFLDNFDRFEKSTYHVRGCDFHEDAAGYRKDKKSGKFVRLKCRCNEIYDNLIN